MPDIEFRSERDSSLEIWIEDSGWFEFTASDPYLEGEGLGKCSLSPTQAIMLARWILDNVREI